MRDSVVYVMIGLFMMFSFVTTRLILYPSYLYWMFNNPLLEKYAMPSSSKDAMMLGVVGTLATASVSLLNVY